MGKLHPALGDARDLSHSLPANRDGCVSLALGSPDLIGLLKAQRPDPEELAAHAFKYEGAPIRGVHKRLESIDGRVSFPGQFPDVIQAEIGTVILSKEQEITLELPDRLELRFGEIRNHLHHDSLEFQEMHRGEDLAREEKQQLSRAQVDDPRDRGRTVQPELGANLHSTDNHAHDQPVAPAEIIIVRPGIVSNGPVAIQRPEADNTAGAGLVGDDPVISLLAGAPGNASCDGRDRIAERGEWFAHVNCDQLAHQSIGIVVQLHPLGFFAFIPFAQVHRTERPGDGVIDENPLLPIRAGGYRSKLQRGGLLPGQHRLGRRRGDPLQQIDLSRHDRDSLVIS